MFIFVKNEIMNIHNVGKIDRVVRLVIGLTLFGIYFTEVFPDDINQYVLFGAFMLLITSIRSCCPVYMLLGRGTCSTGNTHSSKFIETKKLDVNKYK
ncbi:MAG TPA: hypothetical protein DDY13_02380 [Cytophagales bacterium]|nr:hypothetical protein [Cytophagales bacterium]